MRHKRPVTPEKSECVKVAEGRELRLHFRGGRYAPKYAVLVVYFNFDHRHHPNNCKSFRIPVGEQGPTVETQAGLVQKLRFAYEKHVQGVSETAWIDFASRLDSVLWDAWHAHLQQFKPRKDSRWTSKLSGASPIMVDSSRI